MGIIKFEIDIPDFKNELSINLTLKKDGTIIESCSPDKEYGPEVVLPPSKEVVQSKVEKESKKNIPPFGGNMMNIEF